VPVDTLLNARPVSTFTGGVVVPWSVGLDNTDGFITTAANTFLKQPGPALPDDGIFPTDSGRPEITLHFSNAADAKAAQARIVTGTGNFEIAVPLAKYSKLYLIVASSIGDSQLALTLSYADATSTPLSLTLPDWGTGKPLPTNPAIFFNLIAGLHKWNQQDMSVDTPTHAITGIELSPDVTKQLSSIRLEKLSAPQTLAFWGATGVATSAPDGGGGVSGEGGAATAGSGGNAASGGNAGSGGSTGGSSGALVSAGGDAPGGAAGAPAGGAASLGGVAGATSGGAGASAVTAPANDSSGACSFQVRRANLDQRGVGWLLALCFVAARRQTRQRKRR
ncbi:MAG TPA: hypothetical protein VHW01_07345, partial [Polyangiaceae bacterium]|nr:hypothetical protein [Polyangiaceae bacterium]